MLRAFPPRPRALCLAHARRRSSGMPYPTRQERRAPLAPMLSMWVWLKLRLNRKVADQGRQNPAKYSGLWFVCVFLEFALVASMPVQYIVL